MYMATFSVAVEGRINTDEGGSNKEGRSGKEI